MKMPIMKKYFYDYDVPVKYQEISSCIMRRFNITGSSDGMYICNCIAFCSGTGDGCGNFTSDYVNSEACAKRLLNSYGCNIFPEDIPELIDILKSGEISPVLAVPAIRLYIRHMRKEKPLENGGKYTERYIKRSIHNAADVIDEITGKLPAGYTPDYYTPGFIRKSY